MAAKCSDVCGCGHDSLPAVSNKMNADIIGKKTNNYIVF